MATKIKSVYVKFEKMKGETAQAVLLEIFGQEHWFPKRFCWQFILNKKLGGNMSIPGWLYQAKFNQEPPIEDATEIIEKHVPARVEPVTPKADASLIR